MMGDKVKRKFCGKCISKELRSNYSKNPRITNSQTGEGIRTRGRLTGFLVTKS